MSGIDGKTPKRPSAPVPPLPPELDDGAKTSMAELAAALGMDPSAFLGSEEPRPGAPGALEVAEPAGEVADVPDAEPTIPDLADLAETSEHASQIMVAEPAFDIDAMVLEELAAAATEDAVLLPREEERAGGESAEDESAEGESTEGESTEDESAEGESAEDEVAGAVAERNYRQVYETRWHPLPVDQRTSAAHTVSGVDLLALCFDPDPRVVAAVIENASAGLDHVRLIAFHHRTTTGLELITRRQDWVRDSSVERRLLRNPLIGEIVLTRVMSPKRIHPTYRIAVDRDIPELTRVKCRGWVRKKWQTAAPEDRADVLLRTEGRCLTLMSGCTFDAKTTAILCGRPVLSVMFVQSIAKFGASPPGLLAHLVKQPFVRKSAALKKMLLAHPNLPGDAKRSL